MKNNNLEIEKKFLVKGMITVDSDRKATIELELGAEDLSKATIVEIKQGYVDTVDGSVSVRVRITGDDSFLTIKKGVTAARRIELEYKIPTTDADIMIDQMCGTKVISKTRYVILVDEHIWELDVFHGDNAGLAIAEIELSSEDESFVLPAFTAKEVTADIRYLNSNLIKHPYCTWKENKE